MIAFGQGSSAARAILLLASLIAFLLALPSLAAARDQADWSGVWDSRWRDGGAVMILQQTDDRVFGTYPALEGIIEGRIEGRVLSGTWRDDFGIGTFTFAISPDGDSFTGRFGTGEWWTAARVGEFQATRFIATPDASTPEATMRGFLMAGNDSREGRTDRIAPAMDLLDFSEDEEPVSSGDRLRLATKLFRILDQLTIRVRHLPAPEEGADTVDTVLRQAGTNVSVALTFRRAETEDGAPAWLIVVPPAEQMERDLRRLLVRRDGELRHSREHHDLQSPRDTMRTFIEQRHVLEDGRNQLFLRTMDLSRVAAATRAEYGELQGRFLKRVIDRIGFVLWQEIPDNPDQRAPYVHFRHPDGDIEIVPIEQEDGRRIWQFSADTVDAARRLYVALEDMPVAEGLVQEPPATAFFEVRDRMRALDRRLMNDVFGAEMWQIIGLGIWLIISLPLSWVLAWLVAKVFRLDRATGDLMSAKARFLWPLRLIFVAVLGLVALRLLGFPQAIELALRTALWLVLTIAGGWLAFHLVNKVSSWFAPSADKGRFQDAMLHSLATSITKILVIIGAALLLAEALSLPYQGVLAGLGIGGLAVALAAQSTLANFIAGLTLLADKPVKVGDFCKFGDQIGTIESIGLRSVKVRSLGRTLISIPNAEFVNLFLENFTKRDQIWLHKILNLRYETTPDQLRWVLAEIRKLLLQHPQVTALPARARFVSFGEHSLDIEIFAYVRTTDFDTFLAVQEDLYLRIIDIVDQSGTGFAFPSTVNYLARDSGIDADRKSRAEAIVKQWREEDELPFPEFDQKTRFGLMDQIEYPPEGSPGGRRALEKRDREREA
ncbi:MAG: mechanosensitive ion channel family protein [Rhodospirillales bacterium]|nr:MAG: mechanosensitive ion channel family protein [Rhodospirillales bacterium]